MSDNAFLTALQKVTDKSLSLPELINAAAALTAAGQIALARQLYKLWIGFNADSPQVCVALFNMSALASDVGDHQAAADALKAAIAANPDFIPPYINLGGIYEKAGQPEAALELWRSALTKLAPVHGHAVGYRIAALKQISRILTEHQHLEQTEAVLQECLTLDPRDREVLEQYMAVRLGQCKWPVAAPFENMPRETLVGGIHPLSTCAYTDDPLLQLGTAARYSELAVDERPGPEGCDRRHAAIDVSGRRIRVGYVSSDLRDHAIGYLMAELFELHDRSNVEIFAYYCGRESNEALHHRIKNAVEHWRDIRTIGDDEAALLIARDEIDILVDVNGHTRDSRTGVFARRPAPILVNWLGYPGTMGSPYHQYIVADPWIIPEGSELYYSEKVLRLPCYQPNDRKRIVAPERPTRAEAGLPDDAVVFCCFNGTQKITRFVFERWVEILKAVPDSVLWLLEGVPECNARLLLYAQQYGLEPGRLVFAPKTANPQHLARYPLADLFLDTAPYGAHTTASDSLWMGVPVVTLSGRCFASRVCGSLVRAAGLPELVVEDAAAYVRLAIELGLDRPRLKEVRARLQANRDSCVLFDMDLLTGRLEALYHEMAAEYLNGASPRPDLSNLDAYRLVGMSLDHEAQEMTGVGDYHAVYKARLAERHLVRPLHADQRLWTAEDIAAVEAPPRPMAQPARKRAGVRRSN